MKIVIIGTGNVATVFGKLLKQAGHEMLQVYGRNVNDAKWLGEELGSLYCSDWEAVTKDGELYIAAVSDKSLMEMAGKLKLTSGIIAHTAGSVAASLLSAVSKNYGVIYPLQSIRKELPPRTDIPLLLTAANEATLSRLMEAAHSISNRVSERSDDEREKLHVAAVVVNNFTNHLYTLAEDYCMKERLDFSLLIPLIRETAERVEFISPKEVATGPAIRKDDITIQKHLQLLSNYPALKLVYEQLTKSMRDSGRLTENR
jgi:hypothetical protein